MDQDVRLSKVHFFPTESCCDFFFLILRSPCDIEWRVRESGEEIRVSTRTGRIIPIPHDAQEMEDGVLPQAYSGKLRFFFFKFEI